MVFFATAPKVKLAKAELPPHFVRLNDILDDLEAGFRSAATRAFNSFADDQKLSVIEAALRTGNMGQLMSVIDFRTLALSLGTELGPALRAAMQKGGEEALKVVPGMVASEFDLTNPLVVGWAREHGAELARELTRNTELGIRAVIGQGMGEGLLPAEMARRIRDVNGFKLTRRQTMSVNNFRANLVRTIEGDMSAAALGRQYAMSRGMLDAKNLRMANVDKMTRQYRERWFRNRARTIARTEASTAYHFGKRMGWMQAIQRGALDPAKDVRMWLATPGPRTCTNCLPMHRQIRGFNEDFMTGEGSSVADAPAHIDCRCDTIIITERRQKRRLSRPERRAQERINALQDARDRAREASGLPPRIVPDPGAFPGTPQ